MQLAPQTAPSERWTGLIVWIHSGNCSVAATVSVSGPEFEIVIETMPRSPCCTGLGLALIVTRTTGSSATDPSVVARARIGTPSTEAPAAARSWAPGGIAALTSAVASTSPLAPGGSVPRTQVTTPSSSVPLSVELT